MKKRFAKKWRAIALLSSCTAVCLSAGLVFAPKASAEETKKASELIELGLGAVDITDGFSIGEEQGSVEATGVKITTRNTSVSFNYKYEINAVELTKNISLMEMQFLGYGPENYGEASGATLYLTDADNPDNQIGVVFMPAKDLGASNGAVTYFRVSYGKTSMAYDGTRIWENDYGIQAYKRQMYPGKFLDSPADLFNTYFDYEEKAFYVDTQDGKKMVLDLDNPVHLNGLDAWEGFTSDRCLLSMDITYKNANESGVVITKILGNDTSGNALNVEANTPALQIVTPKGYTTDALPKAEVNREYKLPDANVFDFIYGDMVYSVKAFRGETDVSTEIADGYITPTVAGKVKLVYTATNSDGNSCSAEAYFVAVDELAPYAYYKSHTDLPVFGEYYSVPEIQVVGGTGNLTVTERASYNGKELDFSNSRKVLIDEVGCISVSLSVEDYTGRVENVLFIFAVDADKAIIDVSGMPTSVQKGKKLILPDFNVYVDGEKDAKAFVNGVDVTDTMQYQVTEEKGSVLSVKFSGGKAEKYNEIVYFVKVIDSNYTLCDYFYATDGSPAIYDSLKDEAVVMEVSGNTTVQSAYAVSLQNLVLNFIFDGSFTDSLDIVLTGYEKRSESTFFRILHESASTSSLKINGVGKSYSIPVPFVALSEYRLVLENREGALYFSGKKICAFEAFNCNGATLAFRFNGVTAKSKFFVKQISNQSFHPGAFVMGDNVAPYVYVDGEVNNYKAVYGVGNYYAVPSASAFDVLSDGATVTLRVISPTNKIVFEGKADKENRFKLDEYGVYIISYIAKDENQNRSQFNYNVELIDKVNPSITIKSRPATTYKVGDVLKISECIVSDNFDENPKLEVFLLNNFTFTRKFIIGNEIRLEESGSFTLIYKVSDKAFNTTRVEYKFEVRK